MRREKIEKRLAMNMMMAEKIEEKRKQDFMEKQVRVCCMGEAGAGVLYGGEDRGEAQARLFGQAGASELYGVGGGGCVVWGMLRGADWL